MTFGQHINKARCDKGLTLQQLAIKAGISVDTLNSWIYHGHHPDIELLIQVADALDISLDELVGRKRK